MKKKRARRRGLPRPLRIGINTALIVLLACLFYVFTGCPSMSGEQAFRRAARRNLVGPGEILDILEVDEGTLCYDRLLLAETEEGYMAYCYRQANLGFLQGSTFSSMEDTLVYREKGEGAAIMPAPCDMARIWSSKRFELPVIVFDKHPEAVRGELELTLESHSGEGSYTYSLSAQRSHDAYLCFFLRAETLTQAERAMDEAYTLEDFCQLWMDWDNRLSARGSYVLRLYDDAGALVREESGGLFGNAALAHAKRGELP